MSKSDSSTRFFTSSTLSNIGVSKTIYGPLNLRHTAHLRDASNVNSAKLGVILSDDTLTHGRSEEGETRLLYQFKAEILDTVTDGASIDLNIALVLNSTRSVYTSPLTRMTGF
jgi:hypothetical protein